MSSLRAFLALFSLLALASYSHAQDLDIYIDSLAVGWEDWSWSSTRDWANVSPVHSGTRSGKLAISSAWGAVYLHHSSFSTSGYTSLTFWVHGGTTGGQVLSLAALLNGQSTGSTVTIGPLAANSWQQLSIPLSSLGAANQPNFDGVWLQDSQGKAQPTFYLDDMKLVGVAESPTANVSVNAGNALRVIDNRVFGVNAAVWDSQYSNPVTTSLLSAAGATTLRFPGGSISNTYHWATNRSDGNSFDWATNFDTFASGAKAIGAQAFISVNYGSGTPQEAADWVRYSNLTKGYGFKYWEIGNENYGTWENDLNTRPHDPVTYATRTKEFITQMKAVDPTIKIGVVVVTGEDSYANYSDQSVINPRTGVRHSGWNPMMLSTLKSLGVTPDYVVYHRYAQGPGGENDALLLQSSTTWADDAADIRRQLDDYLGSSAATVELICTENNSVYTSPGKQTTSLVNGLFYADSLAQMLHTEFKGLVWWDLRNSQDTGNNNSSSLYGWRQYGDYGMVSTSNEPYPTYYGLKLMKHFARGGDSLVDSSSDNKLLSAYAAKRQDGSLTLLVINKSRTATITGTFTLSGFTPPATAATYAYGIPQDEASRTGVGSPDIATGSVATAGTFSTSFAPYSMTVIALGGTTPPPVPAAPSSLTATAASKSQINLRWIDNSDNEDGFKIERSINGTTWTLVAKASANQIAFTNSGLVKGTKYYYRVQAFNAGGNSSYSNIAIATTPKR